MKTKISILTPCLNALEMLKVTVCSVISQNAIQLGAAELEYIICDGGSQDGTREWIESLDNPNIIFICTADSGLYDGLAKGLSLVKGDIAAYLNAGDYYSPFAFDILLDVFAKPEVRWITGYNVWYNARGYMVKAILPLRYQRDFLLKGMYGTFLPWIQQESTFWRSELLNRLDLERLSKFKYAGDYYIWHRFAEIADLRIVRACIGGFRKHPGQISEDRKQYRAEMMSFIEKKPEILDYLFASADHLCWYLPDKLKCALNKRIIEV